MIRVGVVFGLFLSTVYYWRSGLVRDDTGHSTAIVEDEKIPLQAIGIDGEMIDFLGKVKVTQRFKNTYESNIEAKYMFDLDTRSTVVGMSMIIGERKLVNEIKEKAEARQTYEQAIADHKTTGLLVKASNGIYTVNVGNIAEMRKLPSNSNT
jgi:Ca-activated chloride channel family protein